MNDNALSVNDFSARIYTILDEGESLADYYKTVSVLREFFTSPEWSSSVTGFYLNAITRDPYHVTVRIAYMVASMTTRPVDSYQAYADQKGLVTVGFDELEPREGLFTNYYGGDELLFRRYLATYSWIGMDLLENDFENSTRLFSELRKQPRASYRNFLEQTFLTKSPYFAGMPKADQEEFWQSFVSWPKSNTDWAHMMVNMMIGRDQKPVD